METLSPTAESVNWQDQPNHIQQRALNTRSRRQAAGRYARPSKAQEAAFKKSLARDGRKNLTIEEMGLLATHPHLTAAQRGEFAAMAQTAVESTVR